MRRWILQNCYCCRRRALKNHDLLHSEFEHDDDGGGVMLGGAEEPVFSTFPKPQEALPTHAVLVQLRAREPARYEQQLFKAQLEPLIMAFGKFDMQLQPSRFYHDRKTGQMTFLVTGCTTFTMLAWLDRKHYAFLEALLENCYEIIFSAEAIVTTNVVFALANYEAAEKKMNDK